MGFRINTNIAALVAQGSLNKTQTGLQTSIERLSTGLRINRGADDAAGLTISEKLRGQIKGLNRAMTNAQDGISLIQTAEGALNEDASILNRLRELSIQAQADSLTTTDRLEIQKEVDQLVDEIDRVSKTTEFNTKKLLDGTASALVSSDSENLKIFQVGETGNSTGDYKVSVDMREAGSKQTQMSAIMSNKNTGNKADLSTKLKDLSSFYDNDGNLVIEAPKAITMRGNGVKTEVTVSADMNLQDFTNAMESAITKDVREGGLGLKGSTFAFDSLSGQMIFESGRAGQTGDVNFAADENLIKALGFQITVDSEAPAYKVSATQTGVQNPTTTSANTTTDTASGVIEGLDLKFALATEARHEGTVAATDAVYIQGDTDVVFTIHDTNGENNGQANSSTSNGVTIRLTAGRAYSNASIAAVINSTIAVSNNTNHALNATAWDPATGNPTQFQKGSEFMKNPGIIASMDGYNLVLTSSVTGTSGTVSISANSQATDYLGLQTGRVTGSGGDNAVVTGTSDLSGGVKFPGTDIIRLRIADGDFNINSTDVSGNNVGQSTASDLTFNGNTAISPISITSTFNDYFATNNIKIEASLTSSGQLELRSTETGEDAKISIAGVTVGPAGAPTYDSTGALAALGMINGQNDLGKPGDPAKYRGTTHESIQTVGFALDGFAGFNITDRYGTDSGTITFGLESSNLSSTGEKFTIAKEQIASIFDNGTHSLSSTDIAYKFDAGNRLEFYSRSAGNDSRVVLNTKIPDQATYALNAFGIDFNTAAQGSGETEFNIHVTDRTLKFQIGANKSQQLGFAIVNTSAESLQLNGLDITSTRAATKALGLIDAAVNRISSERSKLGSLQNRLNSTINNLNVTSTNLQATESKIRDVDIATETLDFTRSQIMIQAGTAQLAQAKGLSQNALTLLQG